MVYASNNRGALSTDPGADGISSRGPTATGNGHRSKLPLKPAPHHCAPRSSWRPTTPESNRRDASSHTANPLAVRMHTALTLPISLHRQPSPPLARSSLLSPLLSAMFHVLNHSSPTYASLLSLSPCYSMAFRSQSTHSPSFPSYPSSLSSLPSAHSTPFPFLPFPVPFFSFLLPLHSLLAPSTTSGRFARFSTSISPSSFVPAAFLSFRPIFSSHACVSPSSCPGNWL